MTRRCRICGAPLTAELLAGHCPHCLVHVSLNGFSDEEVSEPGCEEPLPRDFGDFELLKEVARGGMGVVYRARQKSLGRQVALKMILSGPFAGRAALDRFRAEARVAASLQHQAIVAIHEVGESEGQPYFTMDFVEGLNLAELVRNGPLPPGRAARYAELIGRAIEYAHEHGVLHRDLKPANVLIDLSDQPRITDFGLAKQLWDSPSPNQNPQLTVTGQTLGSPYYMAPEQAAGKNGEIGVGTDIYSLGALLYHLVTGRPPFAAATLGETLNQVLHHEPVRPRLLNGSLPQDLETICLKCLEKEPARRYPTAGMVADELARFIAGEPLLARPVSPLERGYRWCRRNKTLATLGGLAALLPVAILAALVMLAVSNLRIRRERNEKDAALQQRAVALATATRSEQQARDELFRALRNEAQARRFSRQVGQRTDSLKALTQAARIRREDNLRDEAIAALALPDVQPGPKWNESQPEAVMGIVFDSQYQRYAGLNQDGLISIRSAPGGLEIQKLKPHGEPLLWGNSSLLMFSPDGKTFAELDRGNRLELWRLDDGGPLIRELPDQAIQIAFSSDSTFLVVATPDEFVRFDLRTGTLVNRWPAPRLVFSMGFNPDGRKLAVGYVDSDTVSLFDVVEGKELAQLATGPSDHEIVCWHPDGARLAVAGSDPKIQIWEVETGQRAAVLEGHAQRVTRLSFHPTGSLLASASWDGVVRLWDPDSARQAMEIPFGLEPRFSPDGRWLGFRGINEGLELWSVTPNEEYYTLCQGAAYAGDLSPDGRHLLLAMEKNLAIWDLSRRGILALLPSPNNLSAFFSSGGGELITCGPADGLKRWPIERSAVHSLKVGPPLSVRLPWRPQQAAADAAGRTLVVVSEEAGQGLVLDLNSENFGPRLTHEKANNVAVSPDGRWAATAGWHSTVVRLWEIATGKLLKEWTHEGLNQVTFTPDSRELIISRPGQFSFWNVQTLRPGIQLQHKVSYPSRVAFSPDQKLMALEMAPGVVDLAEMATGKTVARLENPSHDRATWIDFNSDGTRLIVAARYSKTVDVWDLARVRAGLKPLGLDWEWPEFTLRSVPTGASPAIATGPASPP